MKMRRGIRRVTRAGTVAIASISLVFTAAGGALATPVVAGPVIAHDTTGMAAETSSAADGEGLSATTSDPAQSSDDQVVNPALPSDEEAAAPSLTAPTPVPSTEPAPTEQPAPPFVEPSDGTEPSDMDSADAPNDAGQEDPAAPAAPGQAPADGATEEELAPLAANMATLVIRAGGDRTGAQTVGPLAGVVFNVYSGQANNPPATGAVVAASCTTDATGTCSIDVAPRTGGGRNLNGYWIVQQSAPSGWFLNPQFNVGGMSAYQHFSGNVLAANSYDMPITSTGSSNRSASSGINALSRVNPGVEPKCGLNIAVLMDLSRSVSDDIVNLRAAAKGFADALTGTPSQMAVYTFAGGAPASGTTNLPLTSLATASSAQEVTNYINGLNFVATEDWRQGTNWDQGLWQIATADPDYDVVLVLTDGDPTYYGPNHDGPGNSTRFREIESAGFSANAIKARGTKVIAAGIGSSVSGSTDNLVAISGATSGDDYFTTSFSDLEARMTALAKANCDGTVSVVKKVIAPTGAADDAQPEGGWTFTPSTPGVSPASGVTDVETGATNFMVSFDSGEVAKNVTITETQQPGYTLAQVGGKNAVCTAGDTELTVTNVGDTGFSVASSPTQTVTCTVLNQAPTLTAQVRVVKAWTIDGVDYANAARPNGFEASLQLTGQANPQFNTTYTGYHQDDKVIIGETASIPPGCTNVASGDLGEQALPGGSSVYTLKNTVTCQTKLTLVKRVQNPFGTAAPADSWTLNATKNGDATPALSGSTGSPGVNSVSIVPGETYVLTESGGPTGYAQEKVPSYSPNPALVPQPTGSWHCRIDGSQTDFDGLNGGVTVQLGQSVTCTVHNEAIAPRLTLVKEVENGTTGGTAVATDWNLTATETGATDPALSGASGADEVTGVQVSPGVDYVIAEDGGPGGYLLSEVSCVLSGTETVVPVTADHEVQVALGQDVTCTVSNTAQQATLTLVKMVNGANPDPATSWTLQAQGQSHTVSGITGSAQTTQVAVAPGSYTLSEAGPTDGYVASAWICQADAPVVVTGSSVNVALGQNVTCTVTNTAQPTFLRLLKTVENSHGGTADADGWNLAIAGPTPLNGVRDVSGAVLPGAYQFTETGGPSGYSQTGFSCWVNGTEPRQPVATTDGVLNLVRGQGVTCEFINSDQSATLTLEKVVAPGEAGGPLDPASAWTLTAEGPTSVTGPSGDAAVTSVPVSAGRYELSEDGPSGYTPGIWQCDGGVVNGSHVTVANGASVVCRITNTADSPRLSLVKSVVNTHGGTAGPLDWELSADGPTRIVGISGSGAVTSKAVEVGHYSLDENGPDGYELDSLICRTTAGQPFAVADNGIDVKHGDNVICTFVNKDQPSQLKLVKQVEGNDETGGQAVPINWALKAESNNVTLISADGESPFVEVSAGTVTLAETSNDIVKTDGYRNGSWNCRIDDQATLPTTGIGDPESGKGSVTLPLGSKVTCTIVNTATPSEWKIVKTSDPVTGSTVQPGSLINYTLTLAKTSGVVGRDIVITDDLSNVLNNAELVGNPAFTASIGAAVLTGTTVDWTVPELENTATLTYAVKVYDNATGVTLRNVVTRDGEPCQPELGDSCTTEQFTPQWTVAKSSNPATGSEVLPGAVIEYSIVVTNTGTVPVTGLAVVDDLSGLSDHGVFDLTSVNTTIGTWTVTESELWWGIVELPVAAEPVTLTYSVTVGSDAWGVSLKNVVTGNGEVPPTDCATLDPLDRDSATSGEPPCGTDHPTPAQPKLELVKIVDNGKRSEPAEPQDWILTATPTDRDSQPVRSGPGGFSSVPVSPGEFILSEAPQDPIAERGFAAEPWQCLNRTGGAVIPVAGSGTVTVPAGADVVCTVTNRAVPVDLNIVKSHTALDGSSEVIADPGKEQQFRYRLAVSNGATDATGVTVTDPIPHSLTVDEDAMVAPEGWVLTVANKNADGSGGTLTARFEGVFAAQAMAEITFVVTIGDIPQPDATVAIPNITNTACVASIEEDSGLDDNCSTDEVPVKSIILTAQAVCRADIPWLDYAVTAVNYSSADFTINWWNAVAWNNGDPTGPPSVQTPISSDQLQGSILWPGAVLNAEGKIIEWPGWRDGGTVEDPTALGGDLRPSAVVQVVSNPSVESVTVYPPPTPNCDPNPPSDKPPIPDPSTTPQVKNVVNSNAIPSRASGTIPRTGMETMALLAVAGIALAGGLLLTRRRARVMAKTVASKTNRRVD